MFAVKRGEVDGLSFSPSRYAPEIRLFLNRLGSNPTAINPLSMYVDVNPSADVSGIDSDALVGFIPMQAVSNNTIGQYTIANRPLKEVRKGYSPFINGDILWAKITPCMQNGKSCIVDGLPNGVGFGSTEFHVLRVRAPGILPNSSLSLLVKTRCAALRLMPLQVQRANNEFQLIFLRLFRFRNFQKLAKWNWPQ